MKDHTFDARNDEMRARAKRKTNDVAALADATDAAIAATAKKKKAAKAKSADTASNGGPPALNAVKKSKKNKLTRDLAKEVASAQHDDAFGAESATRSTPEGTIESLSQAVDRETRRAAPKTEPKLAKVDWLDTGLERTGALTVDALARAWINHLDEGGRTTASTIASYANDLKTAVAFFGADLCVRSIPKSGGAPNTPSKAGLNEFNESDGVMRLKSGAPKAMPTILRTRRAFRMALEWARENAVVAHVEKT